MSEKKQANKISRGTIIICYTNIKRKDFKLKNIFRDKSGNYNNNKDSHYQEDITILNSVCT